MITIDVKDSYVNAMAEFYDKRLEFISLEINQTQERLQALYQEKDDIITLINKLSPHIAISGVVDNPLKEELYSPDMTIKRKIEFVLSRGGMRMTTNEIVDALIIMQPSMGGEERPKSFKSVSTLLSINTGEGKAFQRLKDENKEFRYWLNK